MAILRAASAEENSTTNYNVEVHAYVKNGKYCVVNNTYLLYKTTVYRGRHVLRLTLLANAILWYEI